MMLLDTHVLLWLTTGDAKLGRKSRAAIDKHWERQAVCVSAITFWEVGILQSRGRVILPTTATAWRESVLKAGLLEVALDGAIALRTLDLSATSDDPADKFIAASAIAKSATLITADEKLLAWRHSLLRLDARS
jgi:PIN domain nuclease of toxin-antitoxin system